MPLARVFLAANQVYFSLDAQRQAFRMLFQSPWLINRNIAALRVFANPTTKPLYLGIYRTGPQPCSPPKIELEVDGMALIGRTMQHVSPIRRPVFCGGCFSNQIGGALRDLYFCMNKDCRDHPRGPRETDLTVTITYPQ